MSPTLSTELEMENISLVEQSTCGGRGGWMVVSESLQVLEPCTSVTCACKGPASCTCSP